MTAQHKTVDNLGFSVENYTFWGKTPSGNYPEGASHTETTTLAINELPVTLKRPQHRFAQYSPLYPQL